MNKEKNTPLVSIVIPAYNAAQYIEEALGSALSQTYDSLEIIVVNDGSTDDTEEVLRPYIDAGKIVYISQENQGLSSARNAGIKRSSGGYIAFLDADDIFFPEKIERQIGHILSEGCDVSYCGVYHFWNDDPEVLYELQYDYPSGEGLELAQNLLDNFFIVPVSAVVKKSLFEEYGYFDEELKRAEDLDLWLRFLKNGISIHHLPEKLAKVRMLKTGNLQSLESVPQVKEAELAVVGRFCAELSNEDAEKLDCEHFLDAFSQKAGLAHLGAGNKAQALKYLASPFWRIAARLGPAPLMRSVFAKRYYGRRNARLKRIEHVK